MNAAVRIIFIFTAHVVFLFGAYGSGLLGLLRGVMPYYLVMLIWLGASSFIVAYAYLSVFEKVGKIWAAVIYTFVATCTSLYIGVFLAFNMYGT